MNKAKLFPGGGPPAEPLDAIDELVADILGSDHSTIGGICGSKDINASILEHCNRYDLCFTFTNFV